MQITLTLSDVDAARLTAALTNFPGQTVEQLLAGYLRGIVQAYETRQNAQQYATDYTPINPS